MSTTSRRWCSLVALLALNACADLYAVVNDPANAGRQIRLSPGSYVLDGSQPHGGRIELQPDMTLGGQPGDPGAVVLDASALTAAALTDAGLVTGAVRMGRGSNALEWLTVRNAVKGAASVTTDLFLPGPTTVTISHVVATGSPRGFDVRNVPASGRRVLNVVLLADELANNLTGGGQGLRVANLQGASVRGYTSR